MQCTRNEGAPTAQESRFDGLGELVGVAIAVICVLNYYIPQSISWPWNLVCGALGLDDGCRARALTLVAVRPIDATAEWVGLGTPNSADPVLGLNIVVLGVIVLAIPFVAGVCCVLVFGEPPRPAPIYFRRTTGPDAGRIEPLGEYNGIKQPQIYIAIKGRVFDVSSGVEFYGPKSGGYNALAGQDASRALGVMSLQGREAWLEDCRYERVDVVDCGFCVGQYCTSILTLFVLLIETLRLMPDLRRRSIRRIDDLGPNQQKVMRDYEVKYCEKYPVVGVLLGKGTPMGLDFVPAQGLLADVIAADQQQTVTHAQLTRDCGRGNSGDPTVKPQRGRTETSKDDDKDSIR